MARNAWDESRIELILDKHYLKMGFTQASPRASAAGTQKPPHSQ